MENELEKRIVKDDIQYSIPSNECKHMPFELGDITLPISRFKRTKFTLVECVKCGKRGGFPNDNVQTALESNIDSTKNQLYSLGLTTKI